jgi:hypothetical protein
MGTSSRSGDRGIATSTLTFFSLTVFILFTFVSQCRAVITLGGTGRNTSAPTGALANSGWQYEGYAGSFTGTAIGPNSFITAKHIGSLLGGSFGFDGQSYPITAQTVDPYSDLVVYTVAGTLPAYATLYPADQSESGQTMIMFGRGVDRGAPVNVNGQLKGWQWGSGDGSLSWGTNTVTGDYGAMYGWQFSNNGDPNEGQVASGDSGGGVFIDNGGVWELAGVINSVQERFSVDGTDSGAIDAAIFDQTGLSLSEGTGWQAIPSGTPIPTWGYATSIAAHASFIQAAVGSTVPEPTFALGALGGLLLLRRSRPSKD